MIGEAIAGLSVGMALGGAWLTARGYFRSDERIRLEEAAYLDGGDTRIALMMEDARVGRLGVALTALSIVASGFGRYSIAGAPEILATAFVTAASCVGLGWLLAKRFWRVERPPEAESAERLLAGQPIASGAAKKKG